MRSTVSWALTLLLVVGAGEAILAQPSRDLQAPIEVRSVSIEEAEGGADVVVDAASPVDWIADFEPDGSLVLFLSGSVPGPDALDLAPASGLISAVEVGLSIPDGVPTTRIVVRGREPFGYQVVPRGARLVLEARVTTDPGPRPRAPIAAEQPRERVRQEPQPSTGSGLRDELLKVRARAASLERDLSASRAALGQARDQRQALEARLRESEGQIETERQRAVGLQADRLRLIEELRVTREELERLSPEGAGLEGELGGETETSQEALAEIAALEQANSRLREERQLLAEKESEHLERLDELKGELETAREQIDQLEGAIREAVAGQQALREELDAAISARGEAEESAAALRQEVLGREEELAEREALDSQVAQLTAELEGTRQRADELAAQLTESTGREAELSTRLRSVRERTSVLEARASKQEAEGLEKTSELESVRSQLAQAQAALADSRQDLQESKTAGRERLVRLRDVLDDGGIVVAASAQPCLTLREGPASSSERIDCLAPGTQLQLGTVEGDWIEVAGGGDLVGWVSSAFVEPMRLAEQRQLTKALETERGRLAQVAGERDRLAAELETLQQRLAEMESTTGDAESVAAEERARLEAELESMRLLLAAAEDEKARLVPLSEELARERGRLAEMAGERDRLAAELETLQQRLAAIESVAGDAESVAAQERAGLEAELESLRTSLAAAAEEIAVLAPLRDELESARDRLAEAQAALADSQQAFDAAQAAGRERFVQLRDFLDGEEIVVAETAQPCLTLRASPTGNAPRLDCLVPGTGLVLRAIEGDWFEVAGSGDLLGWVSSAHVEPTQLVDRRQLAAALDEERDRVLAASSERDRLAGELAAARRLLTEQETAVGDLASTAKEERSQLRAELDSAQAALAEARDELSDLQAERDEASEALRVSREQVRRLEAEKEGLEGAQDELASLLSQRDELTAELEQARDQAKTFEASASAESLASLEADLEQEKSLRLEAEEMLVSTRQRLSALEAERDQLAAARVAGEEVDEELEAERQRIARLETELGTARETGGEVIEAEGLDPPAGEELAAETTIEPSEPSTPTTAAIDPTDDLVSLAVAWARTWSDQEVDDYLSFYSRAFRPPPGLSRTEWEEQRRQRLTAPSFIEIDVSSFSTRIDGPNRAAVTFVQAYRSNSFEDLVTKTLELVREDGEWKILAEAAE